MQASVRIFRFLNPSYDSLHEVDKLKIAGLNGYKYLCYFIKQYIVRKVYMHYAWSPAILSVKFTKILQVNF